MPSSVSRSVKKKRRPTKAELEEHRKNDRRPKKKPRPTLEEYTAHRERLEGTGRLPDGKLPRSPLAYGTKDSPRTRELFLSGLRLGLTPARAAERAGLSRNTVFQWRNGRAPRGVDIGSLPDPEFAAQWAEAVQEGVEYLEDEARRRAVEGTDRPVFQGGECVGFVREYSDGLLTLLLEGRAPDRYGRRGRLGANEDTRTVVIEGGLPEDLSEPAADTQGGGEGA